MLPDIGHRPHFPPPALLRLCPPVFFFAQFYVFFSFGGPPQRRRKEWISLPGKKLIPDCIESLGNPRLTCPPHHFRWLHVSSPYHFRCPPHRFRFPPHHGGAPRSGRPMTLRSNQTATPQKGFVPHRSSTCAAQFPPRPEATAAPRDKPADPK